MTSSGDSPRRTSEIARTRLLGDQAIRPIAEQRAQLAIIASRLDRAGRGALMQILAARVRTDRRLTPVLRQLVQMALQG